MTIQLPDYLNPYAEEAAKALEQGYAKDVEFSGSTYQVLVEDWDSHEQFWVFLQLGGRGQIKDAFCSCEHIPETSSCRHLALAYLSLFRGHFHPLHQRFGDSLWNHLCRLYEEHLGGNSQLLSEEQSGNYSYRSASGRLLFTLQAKTSEVREQLHQIIHKKAKETEETSIKFSNLSQEEISLWRQGHPHPQLRYDLSFWSDLAKWLMKKQEDGEQYHLHFKYSKKRLPNWFQIDFEDVQIGFFVSEANLPSMIESLKTVESPLKVYPPEQSGIKRISYDQEEQTLKIEANREQQFPILARDKRKPALAVGEWIFIPEEGFFPKESHELLKTPLLHGEDVAQALTEHTHLIASYLEEVVVHRNPVPLSYHLQFDQNWSLHLTAFLFEPGDLTIGHSWLMGNWAFLEDDGFYPVEGNRFEHADKAVPLYQVSDFINQNRVWLNQQEGFQTHIRSIEYQLGYQLSESNRLTFTRQIAKIQERARQQDFGAWVYLEGHGFYSKTASSFSYLLRPGVSLSAEQIPLFIRMNREELSLIPHFFSSRCPVKRAGLRIELENYTIHIRPEYCLLPEYEHRSIRFFDDFVYLEGEGFYELPIDLRLPEKFRSAIDLEGEELIFFLTNEIQSLSKTLSFLDPRLVKPQEEILVTNRMVPLPEKGRGWYRCRFFYKTERGLIPILGLRQAIEKKSPFAFFEAGLVNLREKRYDWLRQISLKEINKDSSLALNALDLLRLHAFDPIQLLNEGESEEVLRTNARILEELTHWHTPEQPNLAGLTSNLRPYQELGVQWLWFLYRQQLSGLLCDEMGLGKTHQAMALLAAIWNLYHSEEKHVFSCHFLVVCPTSVIHHWEEKLRQFLPGLKVFIFYGTQRSLERFHQEYDILLTSYGVLRNERELLSNIPFEVAIFDEIQIAKNQMSLIYAALTRLKVYMKVGLTGTPIENHLRELKSLFDIVLPGYMPGERNYRDLFIKPIEKEQNVARQGLLNRLIRPFVLRRKKEDVLKDLPEKVEEVSYCDLSTYQQQLYTEVLQRRRLHLLEQLQDEKTSIPFLHIFSLLSHLKQICDHPAVYLKTPQDYHQYPSGKWDLFIELLQEARESGQKVVVFSQYLGMLDILEMYLKEQGIGFAALRGATHNRKLPVHLFNRDPACEVFVGSLQAAGLGIDLTAGSVVIHYDRWWNAARENQATDRVHRIGQRRGVQVFKLVTKGTFEEKIDLMIKRKSRLMEEIVRVDEQHLLKTFSRHELVELLETLDTSQEQVIL